MTIHELVTALKELGAVAAALTAIGGVLWWVAWRPFKTLLRNEVVANLVGIRDSVDAGTAATEAVQRELHEHVNDKNAHPSRGA